MNRSPTFISGCTHSGWEATQIIRSPVAQEVIVWRINLDQFPTLRWDEYLTPRELAQAQKFTLAQHRKDHALRRIALRIILSQILKVPPTQVSLATTTLGKPYLQNKNPRTQLHFNVTGRAAHALIAITSDHEIGVDLENKIHGLASEIATLAFTANEQNIIAASPDPDLQTTRFWARKEAYLKARGLGLNAEPNTCDVADITQPQNVALDGTWWRIIDLPDPARNVAAALCIQGKNPPQKLSLLSFPTDYFTATNSTNHP